MTQEYKLVESGNPEGLEQGVNDMLEKGWELLGVPMHASTPVGDGTTIHRWVQAVVRERGLGPSARPRP